MTRSRKLFVVAAVVLAVILILGRVIAAFYTDALWFSHTGYASVFWTRFNIALGARAAAALFGGLFVLANLWYVTRQLGPVHVRRRYGNIEISEQIPRRIVTIGMFVASILAGWWLAGVKFGGGLSMNVLNWLHRQPWGMRDPLFNNDLSFYVFALPFYNQIVDLLLLVVLWSLVLSFLTYALVGNVRMRENKFEVDPNARTHALMLAAALFALIGLKFWLGRYNVLFNGTGFNNGIGYTDVHARLPVQSIVSVLCVLAGLALVYSALQGTFAAAFLALGLLLVMGVGGGLLYPSFIQKFRVDPNEFRFEEPYIKWNMQFTRLAFGLNDVKRAPYAYKRIDAQPGELAKRLHEIPLWDLEPLLTAYNQLQAFFPYYHFTDVDYDRYEMPGGSQQVAVTVREFGATGLSENARTWLNLHFDPKYIRGLGAVVTPAAEMGKEPPIWLGDVNPIKKRADAPPQLNITSPSIFFGEATDNFVVVRPDKGVESPKTAVPLSNALRVLAFAWRYGDKNLLFTGGLTNGSDIVYGRNVLERVRSLAPFLVWDTDPYPVVVDGRIIWIVDAYSSTTAFPLSRPAEITAVGRTRYLHNTVKATVDAASGETKLYRFDERDPITATYAAAFPDLFAPGSSMPAELQKHVRYPSLLLHEQAEIFGHYHLETAEAFYRAEDVWQLPASQDATGNDDSVFRAVYQMMTVPGEQHDEYVLAAPYIARQRQNMTALLIARNDAPHYGELLMLELPRNQLIPGPTQVHAIVEQDPAISPQLSLWRQAGSDVNIGHVRVVPVGNGFLYIMPLYLSAQGSPIPELQRIIASDGTRVAMANSLADVIAALFGGATASPAPATVTTPGVTPAAPASPAARTSQRALQLLDEAERALRAGDYAAFGAKMNELKRYLQQTSSQR